MANLEPRDSTFWWMSMEGRAVLSVVLGTYNRLPFLKSAIESIRSEVSTLAHEVIVIDGGSTDGTLKWLVKQKDIIAILQHNRGHCNGRVIRERSWGYFMNLGFKCAQGKYVAMLSDDCLVVPGAIINGIRRFEDCGAEGRNVGAVAFYWRNWPEQREYWVGLTFGERMFVNHGLYLRSALEDVGWIDENSYKFYYADGDLSLKLWRQGYEIVEGPDSFIEHFSCANEAVRKGNLASELADRAAYQTKWRNIFYDPCNPNGRDWIYRSYHDPSRTAEDFPFLEVMRVRVARCLGAIKHKVKPLKQRWYT